MPLSSLPHPNLYLMNQFLGLASLGAGRKNIYTVDREREGEEAGDRPGQRNVTIGYVVAQRGGGQAARARALAPDPGRPPRGLGIWSLLKKSRFSNF